MHSGCTYLHHKCTCVVVSRFWMVHYSQKGKEKGLELKECYKKRKTYAAFREYGSELFIYWLIDWFIDWLTDWLTDSLIDWLIDWLTDWVIDWLTY